MVIASGQPIQPGNVDDMTEPQHKGGQPALGNDVRIELSISPTLANALNVLVELSGMSRGAIIRAALVDYVRSTGVALPGEADPIPTRRKQHNTNNKEK